MLWLNAAGNLHSAEQSLVERSYNECSELEAQQSGVLGVTQSVSYQRAQALAAQQIGASLSAPPEGARCESQLRLTASAEAGARLFVSKVHTLEPAPMHSPPPFPLISWTERLAALCVILQTLELLPLHAAYPDAGVWRLALLRPEYAALPLGLRRLCELLLAISSLPGALSAAPRPC